jgi:hypothetical protein
MSTSAQGRFNPVYKAMNRPLTAPGSGATAVLSRSDLGRLDLLPISSTLWGIGLFIVGTIVAASPRSTTLRFCVCCSTVPSSADGTTP